MDKLLDESVASDSIKKNMSKFSPTVAYVLSSLRRTVL